MSIINEALKKAQTNLQELSLKKGSTESKHKEKNIWWWTATGLIFIGFLGCSGLFIYLLRESHRLPISPLSTSLNQETSPFIPSPPKPLFAKPSSVPISQKDSVNSKNRWGNIILNGIVVTGGDRMALINNQTVREGDFIEEVRVLSISEDKVKLFYKGEVIVLSTK